MENYIAKLNGICIVQLAALGSVYAVSGIITA